MSAHTPFEVWTAQYLTLIETQRQLKMFIKDRYEHFLALVAHDHFDHEFGPEYTDKHEPCHDCRVEVSTLIDDAEGWYFEWQCRGGYTGFGCTASGEGWHVPMDIIEAYLALHKVT